MTELRHVVSLSLLGLLAFAWSFPLVLEMGRGIPGDAGDNLMFLWNFWWMRQALEHPEIQFFHTAHQFAPSGVDLTLHTHTALPAFVGATVLGSLPLPVAHNVVLLLTLFLNAAGAYWLAYRVTGSACGAVVAGAVFGGSPYVMAHLHGHFNLISAWGLPIYAVLLLRTLEGSSWKAALAAGACLCAIAYTDYYYLVYALAFTLVWLAVRWTRCSVERRDVSPRRLRAARGVLALLVVDVLVAVIIVATGGFVTNVLGVRISAHSIDNELTIGWALLLIWGWLRYAPRLKADWRLEIIPGRDLRALLPAALVFGAGLVPLVVQAYLLWQSGGYVSQPFYWRSAPPGIDALAPVLGNPFHPLWGDSVSWLHRSLGLDRIEGVAWFGIVPATLLWFVWRHDSARSAARPWLATGAVFLVWSLGPFLTVLGTNVGLVLPQAFLRLVPILANARMPGRATVVVFLALAVVSAVAIAGMRRRRGRAGLAAGLLALVVFDYLAAPFPLHRLARPAVYETLARADGQGSVLELPLGLADGVFGAEGLWDPRVLFHQSIHQRPIVGGGLARLPPETREAHVQAPVIGTLLRLSSGAPLTESETDLPPSAVASALRRFAVRWVVLNRATAPPDLVRYVETMLPLRLAERDGQRDLYVVADDAADAAPGDEAAVGAPADVAASPPVRRSVAWPVY